MPNPRDVTNTVASAGGGRERNTHTSSAANAKIAADATTSGTDDEDSDDEDSSFSSDDEAAVDGRSSLEVRREISARINNQIANGTASSRVNELCESHVNLLDALFGTAAGTAYLSTLTTDEARRLITSILRENDDDADVDSETEYDIDAQLLAFCFDTTASKFDTVLGKLNGLPDQPCGKWEAKPGERGVCRLSNGLSKLADRHHFAVIWPGGRPHRLAKDDSWKNTEIANAPIKLIYLGNEGKNMSYMLREPWYMALA